MRDKFNFLGSFFGSLLFIFITVWSFYRMITWHNWLPNDKSQLTLFSFLIVITFFSLGIAGIVFCGRIFVIYVWEFIEDLVWSIKNIFSKKYDYSSNAIDSKKNDPIIETNYIPNQPTEGKKKEKWEKTIRDIENL